jgi:thioredoxin-related protein
MKKIIVLALLILGSMSVNSQELKWETNFEQASQLAMKTKKPLLMFFTGSDWCGWCIRLQNEVLRKPEFAAWAKENVVLLEVRGYPTIWFANPSKKDGKTNLEKLGSTGYVAGGPEKWLEGANQILKKK